MIFIESPADEFVHEELDCNKGAGLIILQRLACGLLVSKDVRLCPILCSFHFS